MTVLNRATSLACLMVFLAATLAPGSGLVLCLGEGGQVTIESGPTGRCAGNPEEGSLAVCDPSNPAIDHCGDCVDLPLVAGDCELNRSSSRSAHCIMSQAAIASLVGDPPEPPLLRSIQDTPRTPDPALDQLRTVILLT
ncbi:MAG: hypothetical protein GXY33_16540 [Phycisphaerae bacterium]|nr:hypothetical protein [Phycisphaerae bacterium]